MNPSQCTLKSRPFVISFTTAAAAAVVLVAAATAAAPTEWLSLCGKCLNPSITSKSGIGTAAAAVEAKVTRRDAEAWCANWVPGPNLEVCVQQQLATEAAKRTYRATADCKDGRITAIDGKSYTLGSKWTSDSGKGRTRWRDSSGSIVGEDNASGGLAISQQWEILCPDSTKAAHAGRTGTSDPNIVQTVPAAQFAVGQMVEAKYGRDWSADELPT